MSNFEKIESISEGLKKYVNTNYELSKLEVIEPVAVIGASLFATFIIGLVLVLFLFFLSITIALYISYKTGNTYIGFAVVSGFYFLLGCILLLVKKKNIEHPIRDKIVWKIFTKTRS